MGPRSVQVAFALVAGAAGLWVLHHAWDFGADGFIHDWVYDGVALAAVLLVAARGIARREERAAWLLIAAALACWFAGDVWWLLHFDDEVPIPSVADALYLSMYPLLGAGLVLLVRRRVGVVSRVLALDGLIGGCAAAALGAALVLEPVLDAAEGSALARAVTLAYPVCDLVLVAVLIQATAISGWRLSRQSGLLLAGLAVYLGTDSLYYILTARGTYEVNTLLDGGWLAAMLLLAAAAWQPDDRRIEVQAVGWRHLAAPGAFAVLALGVAVLAYAAQLNAAAMGLACAALAFVILRMGATLQQNVRLLADARGEAETDALTQLGNRRRLLADLEEAGSGVLVVADLNGFKRYNDTFGHVAGDALLERLGRRVAWAVEARGRAYRMGGDEFCVLLDASLPLHDAARMVRGALAESGEGFDISAAAGAVVLPDPDALRKADARMYEDKRGGAAGAEAQGVALLLELLEQRSPALAAHADAVAELAEAVAGRLGLDREEIETVRIAASLHDIGTLAVPDSMLQRPGPLHEREWTFLRRHPLIGERMVRALPRMGQVADIVRSCYERPDGSGYPDGRTLHEIPLGARIVAVCDAYDTMILGRPHQRALSPAAALEELQSGAATQFDAAVVAVFAAVVAELQVV